MTPTLTRRGYELGGRILPRVSTILNTIAKPGLEAWKRRVGDEEAARISEQAKVLGTAIHAACEQINRGGRERLPMETDFAPEVVPFALAYYGWFLEYVAEVVACERPVASARMGYGGTLDLLARLHDGRLCLIDLKSGKSVDGLARLQLAAYALALEEMDGTRVDGRLVVHLPSDRPGTLHVVEYDDAEAEALTWRALVRVYQWWAAHKDDWKVSP